MAQVSDCRAYLATQLVPSAVGEAREMETGASSLPLAHLHFIIKYFLPHHIALVIIRDDVQQPGEERGISKVSLSRVSAL